MVLKNKRRNQKNLWVDEEFLAWLKRLKGKKEAEGIEIKNLGELTKQIINTEAIREVEQQILRDKNIADIKLKLDSKRIFK